MKITDKRRLGSSLKDASAIYQLLVDVFATLQIEKKPSPEIAYGEGQACFGLNIPRPGKKGSNRRIETLHSLVRNSSIDRIGYEEWDSGEADLAFWLYCRTAEGRDRVKRLFESRRDKNETVHLEPGNFYVCRKIPARKSSGDKEWFLSVFKTLTDKPKS